MDRGQNVHANLADSSWIDYVTVAIVDAPGRNVYTGVPKGVYIAVSAIYRKETVRFRSHSITSPLPRFVLRREFST